MSLNERILKDIRDDSLVLSKAESRGPLNELVDAYMIHALNNDNLPNITVATTGRELKDALELLEPDIELELLKNYSDAQTEILYPHLKKASVESAEAVAKRNLNHSLIKMSFMTLLFVLIAGVGAVGAIAFKSGNLPDAKLVTVFMTFASDMAKLIFTSK